MSDSRPDSFAGVILAAGRARRMGATKQLLPIAGPGSEPPRTMISAAFDLLAPSCGERIVVVVGHEAPDVIAALVPRRFVRADSDPDADMLQSARIGLERARREFPDAPACWLHLADHPLVQPGTLETLRLTFRSRLGERAVIPEHGKRGGHPALIPGAVVDKILAWRGEGGLRAFWIARPETCVRVHVDDPGVIQDIDTPQQYREAQR